MIEKPEALGFFTGESLQAFILASDIVQAVEIELLATDTKSQGGGIMRQLLGHFIKQQDKSIWLEVHESNEPARHLYLEMGFEVNNRRESYYPDGGAALLMSCG